MDPISTASAGVLSGLGRFDAATSSLVKSFDGSSSADPATSIVDQITAGEQVKAGADVLGVADQMLKRLLDITV
jgi:hypothetical protein